MRLRWNEDGERHIWDRHQVTTEEAQEAADDPDALLYSPDPKSKSGESDRIVGYSHSRRQVLCVIVVRRNAIYYGATAFPANSTYRRIYREEAARHDS